VKGYFGWLCANVLIFCGFPEPQTPYVCINKNPLITLVGFQGVIKWLIMDAKLTGRFEPANDCLMNLRTGVKLKIGKRKKPTPEKPQLYLLLVNDERQIYLSSLYPMDEPEPPTQKTFRFDVRGGGRYTCTLNLQSWVLDVVEKPTKPKGRGKSISSNIIMDLGSIFYPFSKQPTTTERGEVW